MSSSLPRLLGAPDDEPLLRRAADLRRAGVPAELAARVAGNGTMFSTLDIVEVATESDVEVEAVAGIHFRLGSQLQLHWLLERILELPRDDRWKALARAALRDDLYGLHRALTAEVLRGGAADGSADERVADWLARRPGAERCLQTLADIRVGRVFDMTTLPVAVREVRNLIQAPGPPSSGGDGVRPA